MVTLIAGGSLAAGTHDPHLGTSMPLGAVHPIWARLRHGGIRTSRRRVLRLMRAHGLLAPSRSGAPRGPRAHDGTIIPDAVDVMGGPT